MKRIKYIIIVALLFNIGACTDNFEELNQNPYQITDESLEQDFNNVGAFYPPMFQNIFGNQVDHNLSNVSWVRHLGTPTNFVGGINNTTYYMRWNGYWNRVYNNIMSPSGLVILKAAGDGQGGAEFPVFIEWAKLIRIIAISRLTAYHGPVIYSQFGLPDAGYDSEPVLYNAMFTHLDEILAVFKANIDYEGLGAFDASYGGDMPSWIRFINSMRLRLAMRLANVDPALAKLQGEKALSDEGGLISSNGENFNVFLYGAVYHPVTISFGWGDTRMSASMESILVGYDDERITKFFDPATDDTLYPDHPNYPYKGIRNGAEIVAKGDRLSFSNISSDFKTVTERRHFGVAEIEFIKAEAALRGWAGVGSAMDHYEAGVRASFEEWGVGGVDAYLANDTGLPIDYNDPAASGAINDFVSRMELTVKWDDGADNEVKLERIMTQKWIAARTNCMEAWVDHRRTGYPKLPYNYQNDSGADWGVIPTDDFLKRVPFTNGQRADNAAKVAEATTFLGGPDDISTRLWWDTTDDGGSNF